ncbi:MAG: FGGY family carbohydrate kinase [Verrucomicrobiales bacterium]
MNYLAIDLGSSFLKGAVLHLDSCRYESVLKVATPERLPGSPPNHYEISPSALCNSVASLLDQLLEVAPDAEGLVMCTQMHGIVLVDDDGVAHSNAITWQDQRGAPYVRWLRERLPSPLLADLGNELRPGVPITTLACLSAEGQLPSGKSLHVVSLPDYVLSQFSGQPAVVDPTNAAAYGLFNVREGAWSDEALAAAGLERFRFPRVLSDDGALQTCYQISHRGRVLNCPAPVGDHQCALLGSLICEGELSVNISTGSQVSVVSRDFEGGSDLSHQVRPFFAGQFLHTATHIPAGRALNVLMGLLTELPGLAGTPLADPWSLVQKAVDETPLTDLEVELSFFDNGRNSRGGTVRCIREKNFTVGHLFRAAFSGMASDYHRYALGLPTPSKNWSRLVFSGGIANKVPSLRSMVENEFGLPSRLSPTKDDTMLGLQILALRASGKAAGINEARSEVATAFDLSGTVVRDQIRQSSNCDTS